MNKFCLPLCACVLALGACTRLHVPTDAQLTQLLRNERAAADDPKAPIDRTALDCLRAWSGDSELMQGLSPALVDEAGRKNCRVRVDGFIADSTRNTAQLTFDDVSATATVKRAVALAREHAPAPAAMAPRTAATPVAAAPIQPPAQPKVDLGAYGADIQDAEAQCRKVQEEAAAPGASPRITGFAKFCGKSLARLRNTMETVMLSGGNVEKLRSANESARNLANHARMALGAAK